MSESNVADSFLLAAHSLIITHTHTHSHQHTVTQTQNTFRHIRFGQFVNNRAERGQPSKSTTKRKTQNGNRKEFKIDAKFQQKKKQRKMKKHKTANTTALFLNNKNFNNTKISLNRSSNRKRRKNPWESINLIEQKKKKKKENAFTQNSIRMER